MSEFIPRLEILNISKGHLELKFDGSNPEALEIARKAITDMLGRGYLIIAKTKDGKERKVTKFDAKKDTYIIKEVGESGAIEETEIPITEAEATAVAPEGGG